MRSVAEKSIKYSLQQSPQQHFEDTLQLTRYTMALRNPGASFVTLRWHNDLRGCIGSLQAQKMLVIDIIQNARSAAFFDPRFPPITQKEFTEIDISLSVLNPPQAISFTSEHDLLQQIQPGIDGLILEEDNRQGTFLPSVWETLPDVKSFLQHLKQKAGLPMDYWSNRIKCARYTTDTF
ncbi:MAG: AmmeMemoRadiSam system protein A [Gammaproteobacteria bacterium]|nr:AmmeMemoRadiSam system protein A [Gammaproteobacteria bacterium]